MSPLGLLASVNPQTLAPKLVAAGLVLLALLVAGISLYAKGRADGAASAEAKLAQAEAALAQHALEQLLANEHRGADASASYQATAGAAAAALPESRHVVQQALRAPLACPAGPSPAVGDVLVPAAALDGLRRAAAASAGIDSASSR